MVILKVPILWFVNKGAYRTTRDCIMALTRNSFKNSQGFWSITLIFSMYIEDRYLYYIAFYHHGRPYGLLGLRQT